MFSFTLQGENQFLENTLCKLSEEGEFWEQTGLTYLKCAKEEGGDTENLHYHIFVHTNKGQRYSFFNTLLTQENPALIDCKLFNIKQTMEYIGNVDFIYSENHPDKEKRGKTKGGKVLKIWEIGDSKSVKMPRAGTFGNDLDARLLKIKDLITEGASLDELYDADFPIMVKHGKSLETYMAVFYGTDKQKRDVADLKAAAKQRENQNAKAENRALLEMLTRLQDRIIELERK